MKPILFEKDATKFNTLGLSRLPDAEKCTVTEERNGAYELELVYPVSGRDFKEIELDRILVAVPHDGGNKQAFRIYAKEIGLDGHATYRARHISYQLNYIPIPAISGSVNNAQDFLYALKSAAQTTCPFYFESDIDGYRTYEIQPTSIRSAIGGSEGSALDKYHGELEWDNWTVRLHAQRGNDNGVRITYGKNLTELNQSIDIGGTITGVMAYWQGETENGATEIVYSSPRVVSINNEYAFERVITLDVSSEFEEKPTVNQVTSFARSWLNGTKQTDPANSLEVNFVPLWQTDEYKAFAALERVGLCDTVYVSYKQLGITVKKKVTKTVYNVLLDRYDSIELGESVTVSDTIANLESALDSAQSDIAKSKVLGYVDDNSARDFTLSNNYISVTPDATLPAGKKIVAISIISWVSNSGPFSIAPYGTNGRYGYIIGNSGTTITGLKLRYWFI